MLYNECAAVNEEFWRDLGAADPEDIARRTGIRREQNVFRFPFFNQEAVVDLAQPRVFRAAAPEEEPGFRLCLISLFYLLNVDTAALGPPLSPLELPGATTFFQKRGPHALPSAPLEERFGRDLAGFFQVGARLGAAKRESGDGALAFQVFPKLPVEVVLWEADEEFPAQVSFTVPSQPGSLLATGRGPGPPGTGGEGNAPGGRTSSHLGFYWSPSIVWERGSTAIPKPAYKGNCHSERSEEFRVFDTLRSFTSFRMTRKTGFEMACKNAFSDP